MHQPTPPTPQPRPTPDAAPLLRPPARGNTNRPPTHKQGFLCNQGSGERCSNPDTSTAPGCATDKHCGFLNPPVSQWPQHCFGPPQGAQALFGIGRFGPKEGGTAAAD